MMKCFFSSNTFARPSRAFPSSQGEASPVHLRRTSFGVSKQRLIWAGKTLQNATANVCKKKNVILRLYNFQMLLVLVAQRKHFISPGSV